MRRVARIRKWLAIAASFLIIVVTCFYLYARWQEAHVAHNTPAPLGIKIQQSTQDFTLSKSEGGRTLFTVRASKAIQFKEGGRADLHNVHIVVYGKESNRFDQISGDEFEYDPRSGNIIGKTLTAPVFIFSLISQFRPEQAAAVAALLFGLSFVLVMLTERLVRRRAAKEPEE